MIRARHRIVQLVFAFGALALLLVGGLALLMIQQNEDWLQLSYRNRWAFRDVPTRRGALLDRNGLLIAEDEPGYDLELHYRQFRRQHPVGVAVHGANRVQTALGRDDEYRIDDPDGWADAAGVLLRMPVSWLRGDGSEDSFEREDARDLRFYAGVLLARISGVAAHRFHVALRLAAAAEHAGTILDVGHEVCEARRAHVSTARIDAARFGRCADELRRLHALLKSSGVDLLGQLEQRRLKSNIWRAHLLDVVAPVAESVAEPVAERDVEVGDAQPEAVAAPPRSYNEDIPRVIAQRTSYANAVWLTVLRDRHPGLTLRPAVRRRQGALPGRDDLGWLGVLVGRVRPIWKEDVDPDFRAHFDSLGRRGLDEFFENWGEELPGDLGSHLERSAGSVIYNHWLTRGRVGRGGVEEAIDRVLRGDPGLRFVERDRRREQRLFSTLDVVAGHDVELTFDLRLQALLEASLDQATVGREKAAAIVDARTGDVLAIAGRSSRNEKGELENLLSPLFPSRTPYVGSVVKPFILLEHLNARRRGLPCAGASDFRDCDRRFAKMLNCGGIHGPDARDPVRALGRSCNFFFFSAIRGLGPEGLFRALTRVGFMPPRPDTSMSGYEGTVFGVPERSMAKPKLRPATWALEMQSIGYGVEVNVLFVARAYGALATGYVTYPSLVRTRSARPRVALDVDPADLAVVRRGMQFCIEDPRGTANKTDWSGLGVLGKTGTAEIRARPSPRNNAWFAGYCGPAEKAQLAFAVVLYDVPHRHGGGGVAAPILGDFLRRVRSDAALASEYLPGSGR